MNLLLLMGAAVCGMGVAWGTNWLALIPWRRSRDLHWTERARRLYPVRIAAASNLWVLPTVLTEAVIWMWPDEHPHWALLLLATGLGTLLGTMPMDHEVFTRIPLRALLRQAAVTWTMRFLVWSVFLTGVAIMPEEFNWEAWAIFAAVLALCVFWARDGWIRLGRTLGLFVPAPERLEQIVRDTADRMKVPLREVCLMRISMAQAYALPATRRLLFSERLVELLTDEEIAAVCTHELAHLTESPFQHYSRYVLWLMFLPWVLFNPVLHTVGMLGFFGLALCSSIVPFAYRTISHKLETRADQLALTHELNRGTYARALARLYEDGLLPAVNAKKRASHPHLYDRLLAAGVTPEFPRPAAPTTLAWHGMAFGMALGWLSVTLIGRMLRF